jgi:hypothetical protein
MDHVVRHRQLVIRGASLVVTISAWMFVRFRRMSRFRRGISYGPMTAMDRERLANLRFIYDSDDVRCVELLRMKGLLFSTIVTSLGKGLFSQTISTTILKSK